MHDLVRLMFDDGATRKPVSNSQEILFTYGSKTWRANIIRDASELPNPPGRGMYLYGRGSDSLVGTTSFWALGRFLADPTKFVASVWPLGAPGNIGEPYRPELLSEDGVVFVQFVEA